MSGEFSAVSVKTSEPFARKEAVLGENGVQAGTSVAFTEDQTIALGQSGRSGSTRNAAP